MLYVASLVSTAYATGFVEDIGAVAPEAKCTGAGTLPGDGPVCYHAKIGMLGVTEVLDLKIKRTGFDENGVEKGVMDLVGSGVSPFTCKGIKVSKNGQEVSPDIEALSHCLPSGVTVKSATYCSDSDAVVVSIKDSNIPLSPAISGTAKRATCSSVDEAAEKKDHVVLFAAWKAAHNKTYESDEASVKAFSAFIANDRKIDAHNLRLDVSWSMGHNQFSDLSADEFKSLQLYNAAQTEIELNVLEEHVVPENEVLPEVSVEQCRLNVKNQKTCGSCWAFSAVGALEGQLCGQQLSEEDLTACSMSGGCNGGSFVSAFSWVHKNGIASESAYPYTSGHPPLSSTDSCSKSKESKTVATDGSSVAVRGESSLKSAVAKRPVSIAVDATCLQSYHGGIINSASCYRSLDHAVLAVGYGSGYWRVKNSWGAGWGESGYFRAESGKGILGIGKQAAYPTSVRTK
jgi:hypothetical protein